MKLFSTTASADLATEVAQKLSVTLAQSEVKRFENSEVRVQATEPVSGETCIVLGSSSNPTDQHLMELFFFADALKRSEAAKVIGIIPYFGYARQNIQHRPGESVSANVVIRFLEQIGYDEIALFEMHDEATAGVFTIPFSALSAFSLLATSVKTHLESSGVIRDISECVVVSPDQGGVERARHFGEFLYGNSEFDIGVVEKKRDQDVMHESKALDLYGDVKDKVVILVDDIVTSGGTLMNAANMCKEKGAKHVVAAITHYDIGHDRAKALQESAIDAFFTTNTIVIAPENKFEKLQTISVAPIIADYISGMNTTS
ncbi:MAG: ribose-phosphate pyrophosphokinase [Microgenomates group bacterium]